MGNERIEYEVWPGRQLARTYALTYVREGRNSFS